MKTLRKIIIIILMILLTNCSPVHNGIQNTSSTSEKAAENQQTQPPSPIPTDTETPVPTVTNTPTPQPINNNNIDKITILKTIVAHPSGQVNAIDISSDGKQLITGSSDYSTRIIDLEHGVIEKVYYLAPVGTSGVAFSPDNEYFISGHGYGDVWHVRNLNQKDSMEAILNAAPFTEENGALSLHTILTIGSQSYASDVEFSGFYIDPERNTDMIRPSNAANVIGMRIDDQNMDLWEEALSSPNFPELWRQFADAPKETPVWLWYISYTNELPEPFEATRLRAYTSVDCVDYSPNGDQIAYGTNQKDGYVTLVNISEDWESFTIPANPEGQYKSTHAVAYSPDGSLLATGGDYPIVRIWDPKTGELLQKLSGHAGWIFDLAFSPDGKKLASIGYDNLIYIWDTTTWEFTQVMRHQDVFAGAFTKDGKYLFAGGSGPTLVIWDTETGEKVQTMELSGSIRSMKLLPSGDQMVIGTVDGKLTFIGLP